MAGMHASPVVMGSRARGIDSVGYEILLPLLAVAAYSFR